MNKKPVIVNGMFRSGTTLLWRILAADHDFSIYFCEPLHPDLPNQIETFGHYRFYKQVPEAMEKWSPYFHSKRLRLLKGESYPELQTYLSHLIKKGALIKFCRMNLRLSWFQERFTNSYIINIIRDPRAVCYSYLKNNQRPIDQHDLDWTGWYGVEYFGLYGQMDSFASYLKALDQEPPYMKIMALWKINVEQSIRDLEDSGIKNWINITYEELVNAPERIIKKIYSLLDKVPPIDVMDNALGRRVLELGGKSRWQSKTSDEWVLDWKNDVADEIWEKGIRISGIADTMKRFGYI